MRGGGEIDAELYSVRPQLSPCLTSLLTATDNTSDLHPIWCEGPLIYPALCPFSVFIGYLICANYSQPHLSTKHLPGGQHIGPNSEAGVGTRRLPTKLKVLHNLYNYFPDVMTTFRALSSFKSDCMIC